MKIYEITIKPVTGFGTPMKGDTIFGQFCWQIAYDDKLAGKSFNDLLVTYETRPFAVFSSVYPRFCVGSEYHYALKTPDLPMDALFDFPVDKRKKIEKRKDLKAKRWMIWKEKEHLPSFKGREFIDDKKLGEMVYDTSTDETRKLIRRAGTRNFISAFSQPRNTINRLTGTTGEGRFAPFTVEQHLFYPYPETELAMFVGIDESEMSIAQVKTALERIGSFGFGKDASTGLGRFEVGDENEIDLADMGSDSPNACYTLAPCVPEKDAFSEMFFAPFTRFGRHGDVLAKSANPFKNPVIMADEGAVFMPKNRNVFDNPYIGRAVTNISKAEPRAVMQGYSLYLPVNVEV